MATGFALTVSRLANGTDRCLVMAEVAAAATETGWLAAADVRTVFEKFKIPAPRDVSKELSRLRDDGLTVLRKAKPPWAVTPEGRNRALHLVGRANQDARPDMAPMIGADLGHGRHTVIPPTLAPQRWSEPIAAMLNRFDFDQNVFCMTRFPSDETDAASGRYLDPVKPLIPLARDALDRHGLTLHLASDRQLDDDLFGNISAHMWACRYGIALFEDRQGRGLNHNLLVEVGGMLTMGRRCALLKDTTIDAMPTDFVGRIYKSGDFAAPRGVVDQLHLWAADDLGLGRCSACPSRE